MMWGRSDTCYLVFNWGEPEQAPHYSDRFCMVNHSRSKMENYANSKYLSYSEPTVRWKEKKD